MGIELVLSKGVWKESVCSFRDIRSRTFVSRKKKKDKKNRRKLLTRTYKDTNLNIK